MVLLLCVCVCVCVVVVRVRCIYISSEEYGFFKGA